MIIKHEKVDKCQQTQPCLEALAPYKYELPIDEGL